MYVKYDWYVIWYISTSALICDTYINMYGDILIDGVSLGIVS